MSTQDQTRLKIELAARGALRDDPIGPGSALYRHLIRGHLDESGCERHR
jgi:hypothetical protein